MYKSMLFGLEDADEDTILTTALPKHVLHFVLIFNSTNLACPSSIWRINDEMMQNIIRCIN